MFGTTLKKNGTPEGTRTPNLLIRSQTLYPIELRVHYCDALSAGAKTAQKCEFGQGYFSFFCIKLHFAFLQMVVRSCDIDLRDCSSVIFC